jgi:hypothetical protein
MDSETLIIWICGYAAFCGLMVAPLWVIFRRAGLSPMLSLSFLIPISGPLVALYLLAFRPWVVPGSSHRDG